MQKAWLTTEDGLFLFASCDLFAEKPWQSPVSRLIFGVTKEFADERLRYLRRRIYTDQALSPWEQNLVKVCAKRISLSESFQEDRLSAKRVIDIGQKFISDPTSIRCEDLVGIRLSSKEALSLAVKLANDEQTAYKHENLHRSPRAVAAILCKKNGELLGAAVNTNADCQMRHAEVNLFLNLAAEDHLRLPADSVLYTSLKPCRMCAGLVLTLMAANESRIKIIAAQDDPGSFGRHNLLNSILTFQA